MKLEVTIGKGHKVGLEESASVARGKAKVHMGKEVAHAMRASREVLLKFVDGRLPVYGVSTQFGNQANMLDDSIKNKKNSGSDYFRSLKERQHNLIQSHNISLGGEAPEEVVRAAMLLRAHCLAQGYSGVRPASVEALMHFLNKGVHPVIRRYGSIGASGDLIPLAGIAAALTGGDTEVYYKGKRMKAASALRLAGLSKLPVELREGLALINGTSFGAAFASLAVFDARRLFGQMLSSVAMALESLMIIGSAYNPFVHKLKGHQGEMEVNDFLNEFWKGNKLIRSLTDVRRETLSGFESNGASHKEALSVQDFYSLRSVPQGFGPFKENLERAATWVENEMNSVNDNPVISVDPEKVFHCANFMGYYVLEASDMLKIDIAQASSWLHAILANLVHPRKNSGLPANLVKKPQIQNGFRPMQLLAASLAVQNRKFAQAHQSFMIPTEGDNQDVNSLATHAAIDLREATFNLERLTAILFLAAAQALELRGVKTMGPRSREIHRAIRKVSPFISDDRSFAQDINAVIELMREKEIWTRGVLP